MNYYLDFDNTLYNTPALVGKMLNALSKELARNGEKKQEEYLEECKALFNRENIYDIYELSRFFAKKYNQDANNLIEKVNNEILSASDLVFEDVVDFLKHLKEEGHKIYMLTYVTDSLEYQELKLAGAKISDYFDSIIMTKLPKYELDINYENGIFLDDNPKDLTGLYNKNAKEVIRIRRDGNKYSVKEMDNKEIKEYKSLREIL